MFSLLFYSIFEFIFWTAAIYVGYRIVFFNSIKEKKFLKSKKINSEKLALIMLNSSSNKEVKNFMKDNVNYLSKNTFSKLNEHLDYLNIMNEEPLKARFDELLSDSQDEISEKRESLLNKA